MNAAAKPTIWIDNDGCPQKTREIVFKAGQRYGLTVKVVANRYMHPPGANIEVICVSGAFNAADDKIVELVQPGDLVITGDVPLADRVVARGGVALSPYGEIFTAESIKEKLTMRNLHQEFRGAGLLTGGGSSFDKRAVFHFSNALDRLLAQKLKGK